MYEVGEPLNFVNRGDPSAADFVLSGLTTDGTWRNLDLSSILPVGVLAIILKVIINAASQGRDFSFRKDGNVNSINAGIVGIQVSSVSFFAIVIVAVPPSRIIEYKATNATWAFVNLTVMGWWR